MMPMWKKITLYSYYFSFYHRNILELGSGLGFTGLGICGVGSPASYAFSDCHDEVLHTLEENILLNVERNNSLQFCGVKNDTSVPSLLDSSLSEKRTDDIRGNTSSRLVEDHSLLTLGEWCHGCVNPEKGSQSTQCNNVQMDNIGISADLGESELLPSRLVGQDAGPCSGSRTRIQMCCIDWKSVQSDWLQSLNVDIIVAAGMP